jgi:hypothetical protein
LAETASLKMLLAGQVSRLGTASSHAPAYFGDGDVLVRSDGPGIPVRVGSQGLGQQLVAEPLQLLDNLAVGAAVHRSAAHPLQGGSQGAGGLLA